MKKFWIVIAGLIMGTSPRASAQPVKVETPPKVEESTPETDKAAVHAASSEADQWAATKKKEEVKKESSEEVKKGSSEEVKRGNSEGEKKGKSEEAKQDVKSMPGVAATPKQESPSLPPPVPPSPAPAAHPTYVPKPGLNEMKGKLASKSYDPRSLRLSVDGGFSVEFTYDKQTVLVNGGSPVTMDDLEYGDELLVRYAGKDLNAIEIDRLHKVARPQ